MSRAEATPAPAADPVAGRRFDGELAFLQGFAGPTLLVARALLSYIFLVEGYGKITSYEAVAGYMAQRGVPSALLPAVILMELGGGLLVLLGLKTRWAAIALCGFCLLTAWLFHTSEDEAIQLQKNLAMAGGFLVLATAGAGSWSLDGWRSRTR